MVFMVCIVCVVVLDVVVIVVIVVLLLASGCPAWLNPMGAGGHWTVEVGVIMIVVGGVVGGVMYKVVGRMHVAMQTYQFTEIIGCNRR